MLLGKNEGSREKGRAHGFRWSDSIKEDTALSLQELSETVNDRAFWRAPSYRVSTSQRCLDSTAQQQSSVTFASVFGS